jgi:hypothetical protein
MNAYGLQPGDTIADYTIESLIGRGGMGVVYLATQRSLSRQVALKILSPDLSHDPEFRVRFGRESAIAASLEHPNVLPVHDAGTAGDVLYLAMRYVDGPDLRDLLARARTLTPPRAVTIVGAVGGALDAAHARGLIHRDVKPGNILVSRDGGHVYLADFGLARTADGGRITRSGSFLGSVAYCSPEQIEGVPLDGRSDLYALACVAFESLAGTTPFPRESEVAVVNAHLHDPPPRITSIDPRLPAALDDVFDVALAKRPGDRFDSAGELVEALERGLGGYEVPQASRRRHGPVAASTLREAMPAATVGEPTSRPGRSYWIWGAVASAVVVAAAGVGVAAWLSMDDGTPDEATPAADTKPTVVAASVPLEEQIAPRIGSLVRAQSRVNTELSALTPDAQTLGRLLEASAALERTVLEARGFSTGLVARGSSGRELLRLLDAALEAHATYAGRLVQLPDDPASLTTEQVDEVVAAGDEADAAYAQLAAEAPGLPSVPVSYTHDARLALAVPDAPAEPADTSTPTSPSPTTQTETTQPLAVPGLTAFSGNRFSIDYPSAWQIDAAETKLSYGYDTTIRDPDAPDTTYLRVDYTPNVRVSDVWDAAVGQRNPTRKQGGYREIGFSRTTFHGYDAVRWTFELVSDGVRLRKIDTFFIDENGTGWGVLMQAPAADFAGWHGTFDAMYESFAVR